MKITLDKSVDMAYIYLGNKDVQVKVKKTYPCDPMEVDGEINLDFDNNGKLIGIEVSDASKKLPKELLDLAEVF